MDQQAQEIIEALRRLALACADRYPGAQDRHCYNTMKLQVPRRVFDRVWAELRNIRNFGINRPIEGGTRSIVIGWITVTPE